MLPQIIYLALSFLGLGLVLANHGKPREPWNAYTTSFSTVLVFALLYWGGFFDVFFRG